MDYTIEGYDIRIEVREDDFVNFEVTYLDRAGKKQSFGHLKSTLDFALTTITMIIRDHRAGAF